MVERINKRSVRVVTPNAEIDVVPVIESGDVYQLPDRDLGDWKGTNPPGQIDWSRDKNEAFDCRFKPLVKLFKWWRRENKTGKRPKGFVLEVLVSLHAPRGEAHYGEAFAQMLESIYASYGALAESGSSRTSTTLACQAATYVQGLDHGLEEFHRARARPRGLRASCAGRARPRGGHAALAEVVR